MDSSAASVSYKRNEKKILNKTNIMLYLMILPPLLLYYVFHYIPMPGIMIAFQRYGISGFKYWVGLENFQYVFGTPFFWRAFRNNWVFVFFSYAFVTPAPILFALLLNEIRVKWYKKSVQTISTLPNFVTWVVIAGIFIQLLSPSRGYVNYIIQFFGGEPIYFLAKPALFPWLFTFMRIWKQVGYSSIIYLAALAGVDPQLYEAAVIDGAGKLRQAWHITLPGIRNTIVVLIVLSFSHVLSGLFEPIFVLKNAYIESTAEILDTYIFELGITRGKYYLATAIGLFKSSISMMLLFFANFLSKRVTEDGRSIL
ncbi:MAG: sugar ABC transporter permease [Clostridia bacterium]|nr:sugar ABC transporter permease [Clostridia bacterium]